MPLRVRTASPAVITAILGAGADVNALNRVGHSATSAALADSLGGGDNTAEGMPMTALSLVLVCGARAAALVGTTAPFHPNTSSTADSRRPTLASNTASLALLSPASITASSVVTAGTFEDENNIEEDGMDMLGMNTSAREGQQGNGTSRSSSSHVAAGRDRAGRSTGRYVWVRAANTLIRAGARWNPHFRAAMALPSLPLTGPTPTARRAYETPSLTPVDKLSQLHLLFAAFPPSPADSGAYSALIRSAFDAGLSPSLVDGTKRSALLLLCERMATIPADVCPDALRIMGLVALNTGTAVARIPSMGGTGLGSSFGGRREASETHYGGLSAVDKGGRTIFDVMERTMSTPGRPSCLTVCKQVLIQQTTANSKKKKPSHHQHHLMADLTMLSSALPPAHTVTVGSTSRGSPNRTPPHRGTSTATPVFNVNN